MGSQHEILIISGTPFVPLDSPLLSIIFGKATSCKVNSTYPRKCRILPMRLHCPLVDEWGKFTHMNSTIQALHKVIHTHIYICKKKINKVIVLGQGHPKVKFTACIEQQIFQI